MKRAAPLGLLLFALLAWGAAPARAQGTALDAVFEDMIEKAGAGETGDPSVMALDQCIETALDRNRDVLIKQSILNSVEGDQLIDRSRFFSHVDVVSTFSRDKGTLQKSYFPALNPLPVASLGSVDSPTFNPASGSSGSGLENLAAQYGISDVGALLGQIPPEFQSLIPSGLFRQAGRQGSQTVPDIPNLDPEQIQELIDALQAISDQLPDQETLQEQIDQLVQAAEDARNSLLSLSTPSSRVSQSKGDVAIRYSRRLVEWGKDGSAAEGIRRNRRTAIHNYEQTVRDVIAKVRTNFFLVVLKEDQIEVRKKLLAENEEKLLKQQKRFDIAKDTPRFDVLTAELDVLNEQIRISSLEADLIEKKLDLMKLLDLPLDSRIDFQGALQPFPYTLDEAVSMTREKSYQIALLEEEHAEKKREFDQLAWDYKPLVSGRFGVEGKRTALGLSLNNSDQTYGLDLGAAGYANLPDPGSSLFSSAQAKNNYTASVSMAWNLYDNMERKGVEKKHLERLNQSRTDLQNQIDNEELQARQAYQTLQEDIERLKIQKKIVENSARRLEIMRKLREFGKASEFQLDSLRNTFFSDQDRYFSAQENVISDQENLRRIMGVFY